MFKNVTNTSPVHPLKSPPQSGPYSDIPILEPDRFPPGTADPRWLEKDMQNSIARGCAPVPAVAPSSSLDDSGNTTSTDSGDSDSEVEGHNLSRTEAGKRSLRGSDGRWYCPIRRCPKKYSHKTSLVRHLEGRVKCDRCGTSLLHRDSLVRHIGSDNCDGADGVRKRRRDDDEDEDHRAPRRKRVRRV